MSSTRSQSVPCHEIHVLILKEDNGWWSAQCLEYDITTQAPDLTRLASEFQTVFATYYHLSQSTDPGLWDQIGRAPDRFWRLYEEAHAISMKERPIRCEPLVPISSLEYRLLDKLAA